MKLPPLSFSPAKSALVAFTLLITVANLASVSANAQTLTFSTPERDTTTQIGGQLSETGVGAAVFNGLMYVAYNGTTTTDSAGDENVYVASNSNGGINYSNKTQVTVSGVQTVASASNPALAVFNNNLYLAYIDGYGSPSFVFSSNGESWGTGVYNCSGGGVYSADSSPSLTVFNGYLWMGYRDHNTHAMVLCKISTTNTTSATEFPSITLNFNPSLAVFNGKLYAAIESNNSSHTLYFYTSTDGSTFTLNTGASQDQSGTAPSLAVHNGVLYLGFRSNDGSQVFLYKYSTDGVNFSASTGGKWGEGGPPTLVNVDAGTMPGSPYEGQLYVFFSSQTAAPNYLCSSHGS